MKEITVKELKELYQVSHASINEWLKKAGIRPIRYENSKSNSPIKKNIYSWEQVEKANLTKYSSLKRFRTAEPVKVEPELSDREIKVEPEDIEIEVHNRLNDKVFDKTAFNKWIIRNQIQNRDNLKRIAEAVETLSKAWK